MARSPGSGLFAVDSLTYDPAKGVAGLAVTMHTSSLPTYHYTDTFVADTTVQHPCRDSTYSGSATWNFPAGLGLLGSGYSSTGSTPAGAIYTIDGGWTPGPAVTSGTGVYAYRDVSVQQPSAYGEPGSSHFRVEVIATPQS